MHVLLVFVFTYLKVCVNLLMIQLI